MTKYFLDQCCIQGPSIKYVTLFLVNFDPLPLSHFVTHPGTPKKYVTHLGPPPIFSTPGKKNPDKSPLYKFSLNCSRGFLSGGFVWKVLSGVDFVRFPFCHNTPVTTERPYPFIHSLQTFIQRLFKWGSQPQHDQIVPP